MSATAGSQLRASQRLRLHAEAQEAAGKWTPSQQRRAASQRSQLQHLSHLTVSSRPAPMRLSVLAAAVSAPGLCGVPPGTDVAVVPSLPPPRLARALRAARDSAAQRACPLALALDLAGPEFRTGSVYHGPEVLLEPGAEVRLAEDLHCDCGDGHAAHIRRPALVRLVSRGDRVLIDDGLISLIVIEVGYNYVLCRVELGGVLGPGRPITLPDVVVASEADVPGGEGVLSEGDRAALQVAAQLGVHIVIVARAHCAADVHQVRQALLPARPTHIFVFAKIEDRQGVEAASEIIEVSDGVVVCRGRIGLSLAAGAALVAQKAVVAKCRAAGVPVLVALRPSDAPPVAEAADAANAVLDGADGLLLTAGATCDRVAALSDACREAEAARWDRQESAELLGLQPPPTSVPAALAMAAWEAARLSLAVAQVVVAASGRSARMASRCRPRWPVVVVTKNASTAARCLCWFALLPLHYREPVKPTWGQEVEGRVVAAVRLLMNREIARPEDVVVLLYPSHEDSTYCDAISLLRVGHPMVFQQGASVLTRCAPESRGPEPDAGPGTQEVVADESCEVPDITVVAADEGPEEAESAEEGEGEELLEDSHAA